MAMEESGVGLGDALQLASQNGDGWGGNGAWWIILLFLCLFGGNWGNRGTSGEAVTEAGLCNAMNFNNLENAVGRLSDQNQNQTAQVEASISSLGKENALGQANLQMQVANSQSALATQLSECCCTTQRGIDSVNFNAAQNTAAINANTTAQVQKVLDAMSQSKIDALQAQVSELQLQQAMSGVVRYPSGFAYSAGTNPFCGGGCGTVF